MLMMIATELIESVVIPIVLFRMGHPEVIPLAFAIHTEPLVLAVLFGINKWINQKTSDPKGGGKVSKDRRCELQRGLDTNDFLPSEDVPAQTFELGFFLEMIHEKPVGDHSGRWVFDDLLSGS